MIADIVIPGSGTNIKFSYLIPEDIAGIIKTGSAVVVPFKNGTAFGYVYGVRASLEENGDIVKKGLKLKRILDISKGSFFNITHREIFDFLASYYQENISKVFESVLPSINAANFRFLDKYYDEAVSSSTTENNCNFSGYPGNITGKEGNNPASFTLTHMQSHSIDVIKKAMDGDSYKTFLLHGVTASGKTEIYFNLLEHALSFNKQVIITVPEIFITNQFIHLIKKRFKYLTERNKFAILHSKISKKEKLVNRFRILNGSVNLILGARSAVFAPLVNPGLIIVDEEHDGSYKQQSGFLYNARDAAVAISKKYSSVCVLGSATPSMESYNNAVNKNKYDYIFIENRVAGKLLPEVKLVDLKKEFDRSGKKQFKDKILSDVAVEAIKENLNLKRQVILFLNRRGFSTFVICKSCGHRFLCKNCAISTVYHKGKEEKPGFLKCHYCGYTEEVPKLCPECGGDRLEAFGIGVQKLEDEIRYLFKDDFVIERIDSDIAESKKRGQEIFKKMKNKDIDILIGTQIIAKGHDFPNVGLVVVVLADGLLNFPDFRSFEKAFQVLTQVSGRAGRGDYKGKILIQTFTDNNYALNFASSHDIAGFYEKELGIRKEYGYPPFSRIATLRILDKDVDKIREMAYNLSKSLRETISGKNISGIQVLGPSPCPIEKLNGKFRYQVILKSSGSISNLHNLLKALKKDHEINKYFSTKSIVIDIDPDVLT